MRPLVSLAQRQGMRWHSEMAFFAVRDLSCAFTSENRPLGR
jgi:hypothetical protein